MVKVNYWILFIDTTLTRNLYWHKLPFSGVEWSDDDWYIIIIILVTFVLCALINM